MSKTSRFGHAATPTRVFAYDAKPPHEGLDAYHAEERAMHRLRNSLVELELDRREASKAVVLERRPDIAATDARLAEIAEEIEQLRAEIRKRNSHARKRRPQNDPAQPRIAELRAERRELIGKHDPEAEACECWRCRRHAAYAAPEIRALLDEVEEEAKARRKALYASREMSWCNFNAVSQAAGSMRTGAPPRFMRRDAGRGRVVVQIQGGATWDELLAGVRQAKVTPLPLPPNAKPGGRRSKRPMHEIRLRIGRDARGDDQSRWVAVRFPLSRPVPPDARIQQIWLVRKRAGTSDLYSVQFVVARPAGWLKADTVTASGACAVDMRWRQVDGGDLLVAYARGDDGHAEELRIPAEQLDRLRYTETLRGIRDREFDAARAVLGRWLDENADDAPEWLREHTSSLAKWRSPARLAGLVLRWRETRFDRDAEIHDRLEMWRAQDKHLADWEGHQRRNFQDWRMDHYRRFAARLRWRYETVVVEDVDWRKLLERPPAEEEEDPERMNRRWFARAASPGLIRRAIEQSVEDTRKVEAAHTSSVCSSCGAPPASDWDPSTELDFRCEAGHRMRTWHNAARNILAAASSGELVGK